MKVNYGKRLEKTTSTLLELCVRQVHLTYGNCRKNVTEGEQISIAFQLPQHLAHILRAGPFARCFQCGVQMFTETCPLFFNLKLEERNSHDVFKIGCINFCSSQCKWEYQDTHSHVILGDNRLLIIQE